MNKSVYFSSQDGRFPLMVAAHPGVIEALRKAAATEQVRYRMLYVRCYRVGVARMYVQLMYVPPSLLAPAASCIS